MKQRQCLLQKWWDTTAGCPAEGCSEHKKSIKQCDTKKNICFLASLDMKIWQNTSRKMTDQIRWLFHCKISFLDNPIENNSNLKALQFTTAMALNEDPVASDMKNSIVALWMSHALIWSLLLQRWVARKSWMRLNPMGRMINAKETAIITNECTDRRLRWITVTRAANAASENTSRNPTSARITNFLWKKSLILQHFASIKVMIRHKAAMRMMDKLTKNM